MTRIPAQTLFLGASVVSYNANMGWGGSPSTLQVELIEDFQPHRFFNIPHHNTANSYNNNNHYYNCQGNDCYVDDLGQPYNPNNKPKEKNVPGKIYYEWVNNQFVSKYWYLEDPGFFATGTKIQPNGNIINDAGRSNALPNTPNGLYTYDIINTPVYFKFDNFEFIGLVKSWERNNRSGSITYTVNLESFDSILENSYVILDKYGGSIFGSIQTQTGSFGSPTSLVNTTIFNHQGLISKGNIPNIFNVYGFLESFGINFFGGSNYNDNGLRAIDVLRAISILTSSKQLRPIDLAFSPFGRLLTKRLATITDNTFTAINSMGIVPFSVGTDRYPSNIEDANKIYNTFSLDLSDLFSRVSPDLRISNSQSIAEIIRFVADASGKDFITKTIPSTPTSTSTSTTNTSGPLSQFVVKIIAVDKTKYQSPYRIRNIVSSLESSGLKIVNSSFGQESNENNTYKFLIGGPQQRLLQVKNYRLSFNQGNYIFNPTLKRFLNLNKGWNKIRVPDVFSTRNNTISTYIFGANFTNRINIQDRTRASRFSCDNGNGEDSVWADNQVGTVTSNKIVKGNYLDTVLTNINSSSVSSNGAYYMQGYQKYPCDVLASIGNVGPGQYIDPACEQDFPNIPCPVKNLSNSTRCVVENPAETFSETSETINNTILNFSNQNNTNPRYFNLQNDFICPYFGRSLEDKMPVSDDTNEFRRVRPVFLDTWTNQIVVGFSIRELPTLSIGEPLSLYDSNILSNFSANNLNIQGLTRTGFTTTQANNRNSDFSPPRGPPDQQTNNPVLNPNRVPTLNKMGFTIKETEMRACLQGFDEYLSYCLGKSTFSKPDLFLMLAIAYAAKGDLFLDYNNYIGATNLGDSGVLTRSNLIPSNSNIIRDNITTRPGQALPNKFKNWSILLNHNFIKDLKIIHKFIANIANTYYGKQYIVKAPDITIYSDQQYSRMRIPGKRNSISVYAGSKKLFYNYELTQGAWEEPGNFIDDCISIGDNFSKVFVNDDGLIGPIVGYNNSFNIDDPRDEWCRLTAAKQAKLLYNNIYNTFYDGINETSRNTNRTFGGALNESQKNSIDTIKAPATTKTIKEYVVSMTKTFGSSFSCIPGLTERILNQSWNSVWSSTLSTTGGLGCANSSIAEWFNMLNDNANDIMNFINGRNGFTVPSLDTSSLSDDFVIVPVDSKKDGYNRTITGSKLFTKCDPSNIIFMNIHSFGDPRIVVTVPELRVHSSSHAYDKDPELTVISNIAIEDTAIYLKLKSLNLANIYNKDINDADMSYLRLLQNYIVPPLADDRFLISTGPASNPSALTHDFISPRAAHPHFFAIPLISNQFCYGPWVNYPDLVIPNMNFINNNMIHKVHVEKNNDLVPWNYGSSSLLDAAAYATIGSESHYQTILENGVVNIIGPPIFGIGGTFSSNIISNTNSTKFTYDNEIYKQIIFKQSIVDVKLVNNNTKTTKFNYSTFILQSNVVGLDGPIISNISLQLGSDNLTTSYRFQTYDPKTGLYNKEFEDSLRQQAIENNKLTKAISNLQNAFSTKITKEINAIIQNAKTDRSPVSISQHQTRLFGNSPTELIVGQATELLKDPVFYSGPLVNNLRDKGDYPLWTSYNNNNIDDRTDQEKFLNNKIHHHWAGIVIGDESIAELQKQYDAKSAMSLDGLLSPVSLYPTIYNSTYNISTYLMGSGIPTLSGTTVLSGTVGTICPRCRNAKVVPMEYIKYENNTYGAPEPISIQCPVCSRAKLDIKIKDKNPDKETGLPDINYRSLCPVLISEGEFRNPYASGIDRSRDSINVVAAGRLNPTTKEFWSPANRNTYDSFGININKNSDYSLYDSNSIGGAELLNKRFFALRGPLMVHGWGFDTKGYPIPNALDMPYKMNDKGQYLRFQIDVGRDDPKQIGKNNLKLPGLYTSNSSSLGDIITKRYEWRGNGTGITSGTGQWIKKKKSSKKFYLNWAERPDLWPVGPIDLRWDPERRVWDASGGCKEEILPPFIVTNKNDNTTLKEFLDNRDENKCPYKMVYITLEQDMIKEDNFVSTYPARGFIDDIEYSKEPLQNNYRRLVYIIDTAGYTAPRGSKLLCRYNRDNGFYEPVSKPIISALGVINASQATIEMAYTQARRTNAIPSYVTNFSNPLNLRPGTKGLFNYMNGKWTLISTG